MKEIKVFATPTNGSEAEIAIGPFVPEDGSPSVEPHRVEIPAFGPDGQQYKAIILDADDSFDILVQYPDGERECVWSLVKGPEL